MAHKYSATDISVMKEALYHDMCIEDKFCPECPHEGWDCPSNLSDDDVVGEYELRFGKYVPGVIRK